MVEAGDAGDGGEAGEAGAKVGEAGKPGGCDEAPDDIPGACLPTNPTVSKQRHLMAYQVPVTAVASAMKN